MLLLMCGEYKESEVQRCVEMLSPNVPLQPTGSAGN